MNKKIWVAYSGGIDSHVLLDIVRQNFSNVHALHINHGTHQDDDLWQRHCELICAQQDIPLHCIKVNANPKSGQSPEEAARIARRTAWQDFLTIDDLLLTAHHAEDQAETILYRLVRGTGPQGLTGMRMCSKIGKALLLRPLLNTSKQEILEYAQKQRLVWIEDNTNQELNFDRNYIRHKILPLLQQRWPKAVDNINRTGKLCAQMFLGIMPLVQIKLAEMLDADNVLNLTQLKQQEQFWRQELLRAWLKLHDLIPSAQQLQLLQKEVIAARIDAMPQLRLGANLIKRSNNKLFVMPAIEAAPVPEFTAIWDLNQDLELPTGQVLSAGPVFKDPTLIDQLRSQQVTVRLGVLGRKAKKIFQEHSIPPWERQQYPLVFANNRFIGVVGLGRLHPPGGS